MTGGGQLQITLGAPSKAPRRPTGEPLRLLVLADFSGKNELDQRLDARRITIDTLDPAIAATRPRVPIAAAPAQPPAQALEIAALDQFHPDYLVAAVPQLRELLDIRRKLDDPATEQSALAELDAIPEAADTPAGTPTVEARSAQAAPESDDRLLDRLLGGARGDERSSRAKDTVRDLIQNALRDTTPSAASPRAAAARGRALALLTERCRSVLRQPAFRSVERAWRSVHWLMSRIDDDLLHVHIVDVAQPALARHVASVGSRLADSPLHRLFASDTDGGWDLVVGDYSFGLDSDELALLATLGALAARAGAPFLAHGKLELAGCSDEAAVEAPWDWRLPDTDAAALWSELRRHPAARWIGLAAPRFLLRQPYGAKADPVERFDFEELPTRPDRAAFFWANPAFACALLLAEERNHLDRWPEAAGGDVGDLPTPIYRDGGGEAVQPALELLLGERARSTAAAAGLIPLGGGHNVNRVSVGAIRCVAGA